MLRWTVLGSGSDGNALVVEARRGAFVTRVLVDNGLGPRVLAQAPAALAALGGRGSALQQPSQARND